MRFLNGNLKAPKIIFELKPRPLLARVRYMKLLDPLFIEYIKIIFKIYNTVEYLLPLQCLHGNLFSLIREGPSRVAH